MESHKPYITNKMLLNNLQKKLKGKYTNITDWNNFVYYRVDYMYTGDDYENVYNYILDNFIINPTTNIQLIKELKTVSFEINDLFLQENISNLVDLPDSDC